MGGNSGVLGYNTPYGNKKDSRGIWVRLRKPKSHDFYDYEGHLVKTMAHEMTHNLHGSHSAEFYRYLDQVLDDYDEMKRTGEVRGLDKVREGEEERRGLLPIAGLALLLLCPHLDLSSRNSELLYFYFY